MENSRRSFALGSAEAVRELEVKCCDAKQTTHPTSRRAPSVVAAGDRGRAVAKAGLLCATIELRETEVAELVKRGLMKADARHDIHVIRSALHRHLDESLGA